MRALRHIQYHYPFLFDKIGAFAEGEAVHIICGGQAIRTLHKPTASELLAELREEGAR